MTDFPRVEERLRPILDAYLAYVRQYTRNPKFTPRNNLGPKMRSAWARGARELFEELSASKIPEREHARFIAWACRRMEKAALTNKTPGSLCWLVGKWRSNMNLEALFGGQVEYDDEQVICEKCKRLVYADRVEDGLCMDCRGKLGMLDDYMQVSV